MRLFPTPAVVPLLAALLTLTTLATPARGASTSCPERTSPVTVTVRFEQATPVYNNRQSRQWIAKMTHASQKGSRPVGLTTTRIQHRIHATFEVRSDPDRRHHCTTLTDVEMRMGFADTTVYIAREYQPGSCPYQAIYRHEAEHVRIHNTIRQRYLPRIEKTMQIAANRIAPRRSRRSKQDQRRILAELKRSAGIVEQTLTLALTRAQAAIDTPQSYASVQAQCKKW